MAMGILLSILDNNLKSWLSVTVEVSQTRRSGLILCISFKKCKLQSSLSVFSGMVSITVNSIISDLVWMANLIISSIS